MQHATQSPGLNHLLAVSWLFPDAKHSKAPNQLETPEIIKHADP